MLVKYISSDRTEFLENGLFRITQPQYLNDPSGEGVFTPFFNKFSDADLKYAYKKYQNSIFYDGPDVSNDFLIKYYLLPNGDRYSIDEFPSLKGFDEFDGFNNMEEYDRHHAINFIKHINTNLLQALNNLVGIFSLTDSLTNLEMWLRYGQHGKGFIISFDSSHSFFKSYKIQKVKYSDAERASISYYEGMIRINGIPIPNKLTNADEISKYYFQNINHQDFFKRLLLTKHERWKSENEYRIIFNLSNHDEIKSNNIYLKKIPFKCFEALTFGWDVTEDDINKIKQIAKKNPELSHLKFKQVKYGELENYDQLEFFDL